MKKQIRLQFRKLYNRTRFAGAMATASLFLLTPVLPAAVPPDPVVEFRFPEGANGVGGNGITTTNTGTLEGTATFVQPQDDPIYEFPAVLAPIFTTNVAVGTYVPAMNDYSVDMGVVAGSSGGGSHGRAVDLVPVFPGDGTVGAFPELTIVGWLNLRQLPGKQCRVVYASEAPNGLGFDLAVYNNAVMSLGINQESDIALASVFPLPINAALPADNWVFFAVTYDPNLLSGQLQYYFGRQDKLAALDVAHDYTPPFFTTIDFTGPLTVGNFSSVEGGRDSLLGGNSDIFRGLLDEIKLYTNALTLDEIQQAQVNATVTPVAASILSQPVDNTTGEGQNALFTVEATGSGVLTYQWTTNGVAVAGATSTTLALDTVPMALDGLAVRVGVSNAVGGVLSDLVTLTVLANDPFLISQSFSGSTTNLGSLAGYGAFKTSGGLPTFIYTNQPSGPFAPAAAHNQGAIIYSLPDGANRAIDLTNNIVSAEGELGSLDALTICGWINSANNTFRTGSTGRGVGVVTATRGGTAGGFVLNYRPNNLDTAYGQNGRLQFHVNEFVPDIVNNLSSADKIPLNTNLPPANWVFFAVTYDGTVSNNNLAYFFGDANNLATSDVVQTYDQGVMPVTGQLTIGNYQSAAGSPTGRTVSGANGAAFRGLIDEVKVFSKVLSLTEIQGQQVAPALPTLLLSSNAGPNLDLSWETTPSFPYQLQSRTNLGPSGAWGNVPIAEVVNGNVHTVSVPRNKDADNFRINRQ